MIIGIRLNLLRRRALLIGNIVQCTVFPIDKQGSKEKSQELLDREWMNYLTTLEKIPSNLLGLFHEEG